MNLYDCYTIFNITNLTEMAVELGPISSISLPRHDEDNEDQDTLTQSLPQPDNGREAWSFLLGAFIIEALLWGKNSKVQQPDYC